MEEIKIRNMLQEDIPQVCEIENASFSIPWSEKSFEESLSLPHAIFLVAQLNEKIIGYCGLYQVFGEGDVTNIAVHPDFRGKGAGKKLLAGMEMTAARRGIADITLEVRESNAVAIRLYEKNGFEKIGTRKNFYDKPRENAIIMWKRGISDVQQQEW